MSTRNILERAFQIADSGTIKSLAELRNVLYGEGHTQAYLTQHLAGPLLLRQLTARIARANSDGH